MDKETLSNYGWIVILVLILAVMLALVSPFGNFVADAIKSTTQGLFDTNQNALNSTALLQNEIPNQTFVDSEGGVYYVGVTNSEAGNYDGYSSMYGPNDTLPDTVNNGDIYVYQNYEYRYNQIYSHGKWSSNSMGGWGVRCINNVADPGPILESINGKPITSLYCAFSGCTTLTTAPIIPNSVTRMGFAFYSCTSLKTYAGSNAPDKGLNEYIIPSSVTDMTQTFDGCSSLTSAPIIPESVTELSYTFCGCTSLIIAPIIPNSITNMSATFKDCTALTTAPQIPNGVTNMNGTFMGCTALTVAPELPGSVTTMSRTFERCKSLTTAPVIPDSVTSMYLSFSDCSALTTAPVIPNSVTDMSYTFRNCISLAGTIVINGKPKNSSYYTDCFAGVDFETQNLTLAGTSTKLDEIGATGRNYCTTCNGSCKCIITFGIFMNNCVNDPEYQVKPGTTWEEFFKNEETLWDDFYQQEGIYINQCEECEWDFYIFISDDDTILVRTCDCDSEWYELMDDLGNVCYATDTIKQTTYQW